MRFPQVRDENYPGTNPFAMYEKKSGTNPSNESHDTIRKEIPLRKIVEIMNYNHRAMELRTVNRKNSNDEIGVTIRGIQLRVTVARSL